MQGPPEDEPGSAPDVLGTVRRLASDVVDAHQRHADLLGLSSLELRGLELVATERETTAGRLAQALGVTTGAVTGLVDRLEQRGLLQRRQDPSDRRRVLLALRDDTADRLAGVPDPLAGAVAELLQVGDPREVAALNRLLAVLDLALRDEVRRLDQRPAAGPEDEEVDGRMVVAAPGVTRAKLLVGAGLNNVTLRAAALAELCRADLGSRADAQLTWDAGTVTLGRRRRSLLGGWVGPGSITLREGVTWEIEIAGGGNRWTADLRNARVAGVNVRGGGSRLSLSLPTPSGTVAVQLGGGVSRCEVRVPPATPYRLHVSGGASHLRLGDLRLDGVGGSVDWQTPDFGTASDRYDVRVGGGADRLEILNA